MIKQTKEITVDELLRQSMGKYEKVIVIGITSDDLVSTSASNVKVKDAIYYLNESLQKIYTYIKTGL